MPKRKRPTKAYKNFDFLMGHDARPVRILSELFEPLSRFRQHRVKDTVVFFGSARMKSMSDARKRLRAITRKTKENKRTSTSMQSEMKAAERSVELARYYEDAVELARLITEWSKTLGKENRFIVCSGGGRGIMEAANRGAAMANGPSIGLNISLPSEQDSNPYISEELNFEFHYFFMRKFWFSYLAKAMVVFPGGYGTMDELFEMLTLIQTRKILKPLPIIVYGRAYWEEVVNFDALLRWETISGDDLNLFKFTDTPEEAFTYLREELERSYLKKGIKSIRLGGR